MERSDLMEPLEAGEDGTFDLGSPSPPPSPVRPAGGIPRAQDAEGSEAAPAAESEPCGSPPIKDDWEKVDLQEVVEEEGKQSPPEGCSPAPAATAAGAAAGAAGGGESPPPSGESLEDFEDAVEMKPQDDEGGGADQEDAERVTGESDGGAAESSEGTRPPANTEKLEAAPAAAGGRASAIAPGLANVRLPMGYDKPPGPGERSAGEPTGDSSDGEDEFHDAYDSGPGMVKDAAKAREMKETGNTHYRNKEFEDAVDYYTMALHYCPEDDEHKKDRAVYLANRAQGHMQLKEYDTVVEDCTAALELDPRYVKALLRRAQANENLEKYDLALEDAKALLEIDPGLRPARESVPRLEKLNNEKNERMKEEALGKLKELGNSILGNFGLSTDNFKMKQDPNTGSYSINFER